MMPAVKKDFVLMVDDMVELPAENQILKNKIGFYDEKWLAKSKAKLLRQIDDERRVNFFMSRMQKQMNKQYLMGYISYEKLLEVNLITSLLQKKFKMLLSIS